MLIAHLPTVVTYSGELNLAKTQGRGGSGYLWLASRVMICGDRYLSAAVTRLCQLTDVSTPETQLILSRQQPAGPKGATIQWGAKGG